MRCRPQIRRTDGGLESNLTFESRVVLLNERGGQTTGTALMEKALESRTKSPLLIGVGHGCNGGLIRSIHVVLLR